MQWVIIAVSTSQILLLAYAAMTDIATRLIPNQISLGIAAAGLVGGLVATGPVPLVSSVIVAGFLFFILLLAHGRGWVGGGDVKLLVALAIGLSLVQLVHLLFMISIAGVVLTGLHLAMRRLPHPKMPPVGSSLGRRICAIERWRNVRGASLPFAVAIACGGILTILTNTGS
jgi:prepilin peptidase CpaA